MLLCCAAGTGHADSDDAAATYGGKPVRYWLDQFAQHYQQDNRASQDVCENVAHALGQIGPPAREAVPLLARALENSVASTRSDGLERYVDALGRMGPLAEPAVPAILEWMKIPPGDSNYVPLRNFRRLGAKALGRIGSGAEQAAGPVLRAALKNEDLLYRVEAAVALWKICKDASAIPTLVAILAEKPTDGPYQAAMALLEIGPEAKSAAPALVTALHHPQPDVRRAAARALVGLGADVLQPLAQTVADPNHESPEPAVYALGEILGRQRDEVFYSPQLRQPDFDGTVLPTLQVAVPPLVGLLGDRREEVRENAVRALSQMGLLAGPFLLKVLGGQNVVARDSALDALVRVEHFLPPQSPPGAGVVWAQQRMLPQLMTLMTHTSPQIRAAAYRAFAEFVFDPQGRTAVPLLRDGLKDPDVAVRRFAAKALGR
jgi:HEAT repeat protein